jgi:hypothetical protein
MNYSATLRAITLICSCLIFLASCDSVVTEETSSAEGFLPEILSSSAAIDAQIKSQVESAIASADDLPVGFTVEVDEGMVLIKGSVVCEGCGGLRTPGRVGSIQQSLGAIVRAVPGVMSVEFSLNYRD